MASIISAGTTSGTALNMAGDTSGVLQLATNGSTTAVTVDASQNVGIGTTSPESALHVRSFNGRIIANASSATGNPSLLLRTSSAGNRDWEVYQRYTDGSFGIYDGVGGFDRLSITTSGNLLFNSGYGSVATAYGCRAWVNFNGTGTVAIRGSGNVSSITDNGTGDYTVNFTTAMPDANYSIASSAGEGASGGNSLLQLYTPVAGSFRVTTRSSSANGFQDSVNCCVAVFR